VLDVAGFAGALVAELGSRVWDCVAAAEGRLNVCVAPFVRRGLNDSVSTAYQLLGHCLGPGVAEDSKGFRHVCTSRHARTTCMRQARVYTHHSPRPSAREEALLEELSLLLPAAAEANEEASVDGMLDCGVEFVGGLFDLLRGGILVNVRWFAVRWVVCQVDCLFASRVVNVVLRWK